MQAITDSLSRKIVIVVTLFFNRSVPQLKFTTFFQIPLKDLSVALLFITFNTLFSFQGAISGPF